MEAPQPLTSTRQRRDPHSINCIHCLVSWLTRSDSQDDNSGENFQHRPAQVCRWMFLDRLLEFEGSSFWWDASAKRKLVSMSPLQPELINLSTNKEMDTRTLKWLFIKEFLVKRCWARQNLKSHLLGQVYARSTPPLLISDTLSARYGYNFSAKPLFVRLIGVWWRQPWMCLQQSSSKPRLSMPLSEKPWRCLGTMKPSLLQGFSLPDARSVCQTTKSLDL